MKRPVLLTRPARASARSARALRKAGFTVEQLPLIEIQPLDAARARRRLAALAQCDWAVFSSPVAVELATIWHSGDWPPQIAAVGPGTASALRTAGLAVAAEPARGSGSAPLLEHPRLKDAHSRAILLLGGIGGRRLLDRELRARGATVRRLALYRRVRIALSREDLSAAIVRRPVLILSSAEILRHWAALAREHALPQALDLPLVVPTERVVQLATTLGFQQRPRVPAQMSDAELIRTLRALRDTDDE